MMTAPRREGAGYLEAIWKAGKHLREEIDVGGRGYQEPVPQWRPRLPGSLLSSCPYGEPGVEFSGLCGAAGEQLLWGWAIKAS